MVARKKWEMKIELTEQQANELVTYLASLSDRLVAQHKESFSGVEQFLLLSTIQGVDRLWVEIREQVEAQTPKVELEPVYQMTAQA